ncbi:MAG: type II toxin-antitoxin system YafQ family toxin [Bacteroides sp.]
MFHIVSLLENEIEIPKKYLPHRLIGEYKGCMECHIENDFLLIWQDPLHDVIWLERLGSHSELFGKKR